MSDNQEYEAQALTESQRRLSFIRKFDGQPRELPLDERRKAGGLLKSAMEQVFASFAGYTEGSLMTYLNLGLTFEDNSGITFVVTTSSLLKGSGGPSGKVRVIERDPFGNDRETYDYELSNDEQEVLRIDVGDETIRRVTGEPGMVRMIGSDPSPNSPLYDPVQNFRLSEQFAENNQPVDSLEIEHVRELLFEATPPQS